jgi:hypothetical protein
LSCLAQYDSDDEESGSLVACREASTGNEDSNGGGNDDASDSGAHSGAASPGRNSSGPVDGGAGGAGTSDPASPAHRFPVVAGTVAASAPARAGSLCNLGNDDGSDCCHDKQPMDACSAKGLEAAGARPGGVGGERAWPDWAHDLLTNKSEKERAVWLHDYYQR